MAKIAVEHAVGIVLTTQALQPLPVGVDHTLHSLGLVLHHLQEDLIYRSLLPLPDSVLPNTRTVESQV